MPQGISAVRPIKRPLPLNEDFGSPDCVASNKHVNE